MIEYGAVRGKKKDERLIKWLVVILVGAVMLLLASLASAQTPTTQVEDGTNRIVKAGDLANKAIRVNVVAGASGGGTVTQGAGAGAATNFWNFQLTDGTNFYKALTDTQLRASAVHTICDSGCTPGGSFADASAFTFGATAISNTGFVVDDVGTNAVAENSAGAARMSGSRILYVDLTQTGANATPIAISAASLPSHPVTNAGTFAVQASQAGTWTVTGAGGTFPVTGTFWPTTAGAPGSQRLSDGAAFYDAAKTGQLPAALDGSGFLKVHEQGTATVTGPLTDTQLRATPVPISGTVALGAGAAVVGHVINDASSAVIGHVIADSGSTTAVTGNVTVIQGTGTNLHAVIDSGSTTAATQATGSNLHMVVDSGTVTTVSTVTALTAITNALPAGSNVIGHVIADTGSTTAATQATAANLNATVVGTTLTKGTQGAAGFSVQELHDAGRTTVTFTADNVTPILTTDTIITFSKLVGDTVTASQTTYAVTAAKTLRITHLDFSMIPNSTTVAYLRVRLRQLASGACTVAAGHVVGVWGVSSPPGTIAANAGGALTQSIDFPDGIEFAGATMNVCLSANVLGAAAQTVNITAVGYEY